MICVQVDAFICLKSSSFYRFSIKFGSPKTFRIEYKTPLSDNSKTYQLGNSPWRLPFSKKGNEICFAQPQNLVFRQPWSKFLVLWLTLQVFYQENFNACLSILLAMNSKLILIFLQGLIKVVFATGTLAAGINMPARSTIVSTTSRRHATGYVNVTHNELLQMAGRAGRRGFDTEGK